MENEYIEKTPFYKKKALVIPVIVLMLAGLVFAVAPYFHVLQADLVVTEARSSGEVDFELGCVSGDTVVQELTIHNAAQVDLCANVDYSEVTNTGVDYTSNLPQDVVLTANSDTIVNAEFTCDELTEEGLVEGIIGFSKIACV